MMIHSNYYSSPNDKPTATIKWNHQNNRLKIFDDTHHLKKESSKIGFNCLHLCHGKEFELLGFEQTRIENDKK